MLFWKNIDDPSNNISGRALRPIFDQTGSRPKFLHVLARFRNTFLIPQISPEIQIPAPNGKVQENRKFHNLKIEILFFFFFLQKPEKKKVEKNSMSSSKNNNNMNDVDRLFACFKCGISPPSKSFIPLSVFFFLF